jgi:hypothetical protein
VVFFGMIPVEVLSVQVEERTGLPVVLLREVADPHRVLPIFVGESEAVAIALGLDHTETARPFTHDLLVTLLGRTGAKLDEVAVTELRDGTFYAELRLSGASGPHTVSSRPSDALALAVRVDAPVLVASEVLEEGGVVPIDPDALIDAEVEAFRAELDALEPGDFEGPEST